MQGTAAQSGSTAAETQYLRFHVGLHAFALPLDELREILRVPLIASVPLSPRSLRGLVNHRGIVLPIIHLHYLFGVAEYGESTPASRVLVLDGEQPIGFVVDRVDGIFSAASGQIEEEARNDQIDKNYLSGMMRTGKDVTLLVNFPKILEQEFVASARTQPHLGQYQEDDDDTGNKQSVRLVTLKAAEQEYAFPVERVEEIIFLQDRIVRIPNTDAAVAGVIQLHNALLPVFHLRALLSLPEATVSPDNRIVIISVQVEDAQRKVGLIVDAVSEVLQVSEDSLESVPRFFGHAGAKSEITSICRLREEDRLISVLSGEALFGADEVKTLIGNMQEAEAEGLSEDAAATADEVQLVVFRLLDEELALPAADVQEILNLPPLLPLPKAPDYIAGVFNHRGTVTPVINQRRRLGLPDLAQDVMQRVIMLDIQGNRTGFLVDSLTEILRVPMQALGNPPTLFQSHMLMVKHVVHPSADRMVLLLNTEQLLNSVEIKALAKAGKEKLK